MTQQSMMPMDPDFKYVAEDKYISIVTKDVLNFGQLSYIPYAPPKTEGHGQQERYSVCMLWDSSRKQLENFSKLRVPGFTDGNLRKTRPKLFTIKPTRKMGLGVFAQIGIKAGELVLAERPMIITPLIVRPFVLPELSEAEMKSASLKAYEGILAQIADKLTNEDWDAFWTLDPKGKIQSEDIEPLLGIFRKYGCLMRFDFDEDPRICYRAIGIQGSRINHSCEPNLDIKFDTRSFSLHYTAMRDIKAGEQLCYAYCDLTKPRKEQKETLKKHWDFVCQCTACRKGSWPWIWTRH